MPSIDLDGPQEQPFKSALLYLQVRSYLVGYLCPFFHSENTDPELVAIMLTGIRTLEGLSATIVPVNMPDLSGYMEAWGVLCSSEALAAHESTYSSRRYDYGPWFQGWLENGAQVTGAEYAKANNVRSAYRGLLPIYSKTLT
jgi:Asp-tRNA(Asn)/Glu-tRNA(Gln) amidotransferase A subunit family amidase